VTSATTVPPATAAAAATAPATPTAAPATAATNATTPATDAALRARRRRRLKRVGLPLLLAILLLGIDLSRPPASQASARLLLGGIHLYQATLSPRLGAMGVQCRFRPTCSHYAAGAIARYGALSGSLRAAWRVARCGPWTPLGTDDPP
jgi:putative membrane protein insertion efficiency factor